MIKEHYSPGHHQLGHCSNWLREAICLPRHATVGTSNLIIDLIKTEQVSEMYCMIYEAMQNGEGYGVDEYTSEEEFISELNGGPAFALMNAESGKMVAGFALAHSKYYRGTEIQAVDPVIIVKKCSRGQGLGEFIFQTCLQFAKKLKYAGVYADTFTNNVAMAKIIEKRSAFQKVGTLPLGGRMPDGSVVGMNLYYMDLTADDSLTVD